MRKECFVLQAVRVSPPNGRLVDDCFVRSAFVYVLSIFSAFRPETVEKGVSFFDCICAKRVLT